MKYEAKRKPRKCPKCGGKVATVLYGYPIFLTLEEERKAKEEYVLGGCCISSFSPKWQCKDCDIGIFKSSS